MLNLLEVCVSPFAVIVGILTGISIGFTYTNSQIDALSRRICELENEVEDKNEKLEDLNNKLSSINDIINDDMPELVKA